MTRDLRRSLSISKKLYEFSRAGYSAAAMPVVIVTAVEDGKWR